MLSIPTNYWTAIQAKLWISRYSIKSYYEKVFSNFLQI